ncbi:ORF29 [Aviadenovirus cerasi]|uniref:ORF29 n=1 Tax=Fowl aviadenovirus 5 TaxID=172861 RepID=A0A6M3Z5A6_9ADEN|nr:ORF29 [Fowl aviadenovirus 5]
MLVILLKFNGDFLQCATTPHGHPPVHRDHPLWHPPVHPLYRRPPPMDTPLYTPLYIFFHRLQWNTAPLCVRLH